MKEEFADRNATPRRPLESGCCLWKPILPPIEGNRAADPEGVAKDAAAPGDAWQGTLSGSSAELGES
ncbi:MAG: hypothetical protein QM739_14710 [Propionivibrio sp.]